MKIDMSQSRSCRPPPGSKTSRFLTAEENETLASACKDRKWEVQALGVAELYKSGPSPRHDRWHRAECGVACFIKDNTARAFFIRLFDFNRNDFVWEQELFIEFTYSTPLRYFHTFEADDCQAGLNFAYEEEANSFHAAVEAKLETRRRKRDEKRRNANLVQPSVPKHDPQIPCNANGISNQYIYKKKKYKKDKKSKYKKSELPKITKDDISCPTNFKHLQHVGWDPTKGFDLHNVTDNAYTKFFALANVSQKDLEDDQTRMFIYDFIEKNGGIEALNDASDPALSPPPQVPVREATPSSRSCPAPPNSRPARPAPPSRGVPHRQHPPSVPFSNGTAMSSPPPPPPPPPSGGMGKGAPPPPPPPPPPVDFGGPRMNGGAPPPPPPPGLPGATSDPKTALLEQIRKGKTLNHVDPETDSIQSNPDSRDALLDQIRGGVQLKSVQGSPRASSGENKLEGLAGALARALQERARACLPDESDSSEGSDEDEDEWDD